MIEWRWDYHGREKGFEMLICSTGYEGEIRTGIKNSYMN